MPRPFQDQPPKRFRRRDSATLAGSGAPYAFGPCGFLRRAGPQRQCLEAQGPAGEDLR